MDPLVPMGQGNLQQLSGTLDRSHPKKRNESPFTTIQGSFSLIAPIYIYIFFFFCCSLPLRNSHFGPVIFFCDQGAPGFENSFVGKSHNASKRNTFPRRNFLACGKNIPPQKSTVISSHLLPEALQKTHLFSGKNLWTTPPSIDHSRAAEAMKLDQDLSKVRMGDPWSWHTFFTVSNDGLGDLSKFGWSPLEWRGWFFAKHAFQFRGCREDSHPFLHVFFRFYWWIHPVTCWWVPSFQPPKFGIRCFWSYSNEFGVGQWVNKRKRMVHGWRNIVVDNGHPSLELTAKAPEKRPL